jgi:hypothetical protein
MGWLEVAKDRRQVMSELTPGDLRALLEYDPLTGRLTWKARPASMFPGGKQTPEHNAAIWNGKFAGVDARTTGRYARVAIMGGRYYAHRVAWAIHYGQWPALDVDHINGNKVDNRIANLREATVQENGQNIPIKCNNRSGTMGVRWREHASGWEAYITVDGRFIHIGYFKAKEDAIAARRDKERELGFHQNHGRIAA